MKAQMGPKAIVAAAALVLIATGVIAQAAPVLAEQQQGNVRFVTGGIGSDESAAIKAQMHDYPLALTLAEKSGEYVANVPVTIDRATGESVLHVNAGPYLLVKLAPGSYRITATYQGHTQVRNATISKSGTTSLVFTW